MPKSAQMRVTLPGDHTEHIEDDTPATNSGIFLLSPDLKGSSHTYRLDRVVCDGITIHQ